ncbi:MAG: biopolymer transporter ExbD [Phycisphaerae bacterium]|nr:biopolymer transporter ExbD [Phycisphaerae bacterium]
MRTFQQRAEVSVLQRLRRGRGEMGVNLTPMVDVIFMLTIFYMLVTRFFSVEQVAMQLPSPDESLARAGHLPDRVVINCRPGAAADGGDVLYSLGPNAPESLASITQRLQAMKRDVPALKVVIRADRRLPYADVKALMRTVATSGIDMLHVVAHVEEEP